MGRGDPAEKQKLMVDGILKKENRTMNYWKDTKWYSKDICTWHVLAKVLEVKELDLARPSGISDGSDLLVSFQLLCHLQLMRNQFG